MITEKKLLEMKEAVEKAKTKVAGLKGQETALLNQIKKEFGCEDIEELDEKIAQEEKALEKINKQIEKGSKELEEKYDFN